MIDRRLLLQSAATTVAASALVPTQALAQAAAGQSASAGTVETLTGAASASRDGKKRTLAGSAEVFIADQIRTEAGARLALRLGQRTVLRLGEKTSVRIEQYLVDAGGEIVLDDGAILFERVGPPSKAPLNVRSTYGLIAVRGTTFFAGPSNGVFGVFVDRGRVAVSAANKIVIVNAKQGTDIARRGAQPTDAKEWGPPRIAAALASVR